MRLVMRYRTWIPLAVIVLLALAPSCNRFKKTELPNAARQPKLTGTAYINEGDSVHMIVDVRAARIIGSAEFLPLHVALLNRTKQDMVVNRESFSLESPASDLLPLSSYAEFEDNYPRHRVDLRIGRDFIEFMNGKYPSPPFTKRPLEFYPIKESGVPPRNEISLRQGEMAIGYIYFRLPDTEFLTGDGTSKLLIQPLNWPESYVVDIRTYKKVKQDEES
jgi:hypothetical protein